MRSIVRRGVALSRRYRWLLPAISFVAGWLSFVMVRRGESLARGIALLALLGWLWLLVEPWVRRQVEQRKPRVGNFLVNMISQSLQQELLFFSLPFLIGATQADFGQIVFTTGVALAAVFCTIDPLYERYVAKRATRRLSFHAFCSWMAALVVLPMVLGLPLERALPVSLLTVAAWLIVTLPLSLKSLRLPTVKLAWLAGIVGLPLLLWAWRAHVPAAGLAVTEMRLTQSIEGLNPGAPTGRIPRSDLEQGVIAFAAIRAPTGLAQDVIFEWRHGRNLERIAAQIQGGKAEGFRTYSRKRVFPADPVGPWVVDLVTPQDQLLARVRFTVESGP